MWIKICAPLYIEVRWEFILCSYIFLNTMDTSSRMILNPQSTYPRRADSSVYYFSVFLVHCSPSVSSITVVLIQSRQSWFGQDIQSIQILSLLSTQISDLLLLIIWKITPFRRIIVMGVYWIFDSASAASAASTTTRLHFQILHRVRGHVHAYLRLYISRQ